MASPLCRSAKATDDGEIDELAAAVYLTDRGRRLDLAWTTKEPKRQEASLANPGAWLGCRLPPL